MRALPGAAAVVLVFALGAACIALEGVHPVTVILVTAVLTTAAAKARKVLYRVLTNERQALSIIREIEQRQRHLEATIARIAGTTGRSAGVIRSIHAATSDPSSEARLGDDPKGQTPTAATLTQHGRGSTPAPPTNRGWGALRDVMEEGFAVDRTYVLAGASVDHHEIPSGNVRTLRPGTALATARDQKAHPSLVIIDREAFRRGPWEGAESSAGIGLFHELRVVMEHCKSRGATILYLDDGTRPPDVNTRAIAALATSKLDESSAWLPWPNSPLLFAMMSKVRDAASKGRL